MGLHPISITLCCRLAIEFLIDDEEIIPIDIGTHDRVCEFWMKLDEFLDFEKFKIQDATPLPRQTSKNHLAVLAAQKNVFLSIICAIACFIAFSACKKTFQWLEASFGFDLQGQKPVTIRLKRIISALNSWIYMRKNMMYFCTAAVVSDNKYFRPPTRT